MPDLEERAKLTKEWAQGAYVSWPVHVPENMPYKILYYCTDCKLPIFRNKPANKHQPPKCYQCWLKAIRLSNMFRNVRKRLDRKKRVD